MKNNQKDLAKFRKLLTTSSSGPVRLTQTKGDANCLQVSRFIGNNTKPTHLFELNEKYISKYGTSSNNTYLTFTSNEEAKQHWDELFSNLTITKEELQNVIS